MRSWLAVLALVSPAVAGETLRCEPALPYYCANIHVGCAGRSRLRTEGFDLVLGDGAKARFDGGREMALSVRRDPAAVLLRDVAGPDWIRMLPDGTYAMRLQSHRPALMTRGRCEPVGTGG